MKNMIGCFLAIFFILSMFSCKRKEKEIDDGNVGGKGGKATLKITTKHHGKDIDSCTVYIKYNELNTPSSYDDSAKAIFDSNGKPVVTFAGLKKGNYYLFGRGWDTTISNVVIGGLPFSIEDEISQDINLPVTEGD